MPSQRAEKKWISTYDPHSRNPVNFNKSRARASLLNSVEDRAPDLPRGPNVIVLEALSETDTRWEIANFARGHRIAIVNHYWCDKGCVVTFHRPEDAALFLMFWSCKP